LLSFVREWAGVPWLDVIVVAIGIYLEIRTHRDVRKIWQQLRTPIDLEAPLRIARRSRQWRSAVVVGCAVGVPLLAATSALVVTAMISAFVLHGLALLRTHRFIVASRRDGAVGTATGPFVFVENDGKLAGWMMIEPEALFAELQRIKPPASWN
jgi:hypothetical protein